jgi:hypothetical protein
MTRLRAALTLATIAALGLPVSAYLKFGVEREGQTVVLRWARTPIPYAVSDRLVPGMTLQQFDEALRRAFAAWQSVPTAVVSFERLGFTGARPSDDDAINVIGFEVRPDLDRVLATTSYTFDLVRSEIVEADILFNAAQPWSASAGGETGRFDLESIALHEVGHVLGLGHSAIGETELMAGARRRVTGSGTVMFPIAFPGGSLEGRTLRSDDIAGVSDIYPRAGARASLGSLSGRVTKNGQGLFGAHLVAYNLRTGQLVGGFALDTNGAFVIAGLDPGPCIVRVEPVDDADVDSFFDGSTPVDVGFGVTYYDRIAIVPEGGNAPDIDIAVRAR